MKTCLGNLFKQNSKDLKEFDFEQVVRKTEACSAVKGKPNSSSFRPRNQRQQRQLQPTKHVQAETRRASKIQRPRGELSWRGKGRACQPRDFKFR